MPRAGGENMCLAIPGMIKEVLEDNKAVVSFMGIEKEIAIDLLESVREGEYVIVHAGFAVNKLNREEADETIKYLEQFL